MAKIFRPSSREAKILSKIESSKEYARRKAISAIQDLIEPLSNAIAMKLVENKLVETVNAGSSSSLPQKPVFTGAWVGRNLLWQV